MQNANYTLLRLTLLPWLSLALNGVDLCKGRKNKCDFQTHLFPNYVQPSVYFFLWRKVFPSFSSYWCQINTNHTMHSFYNEDNNLSHQNIHFDKAKQKWWSTNSICYYIRKGHKKHQRWHFNSGLINMLQFLNRGTFDPITHPVFSLWHHILQDATWLLALLEITLQRQVGWLAAARLEACHLLQSDSVELEVCGKHWANPTLVFVLRWKTNQKSLEEEMLRLRVLLQETESV